MGDVDVLALRYGQKLRLCAPSAYNTKDVSAVSASTSSSSAVGASDSYDLGIGYYEKQGRHGILSCVPPLGAGLEHLFNEDEFLVLDPLNLRAPGDVVEYGHTVVLVNQHGMVWNNKTGGITGYIGPRPRHTPGEMFVAFRRGGGKDKEPRDPKDRSRSSVGGSPFPPLERDVSTASTSSLISSASSSTLAAGAAADAAADGPVHFGDHNIAITVMESNRHSKTYNKRLTNFKKPTSKIVGGYICCDGKGTELRFTLSPAKPKVEQISMLNKLITAYNYGQKIALPLGLLEKQLTSAGSGSSGGSISSNGGGSVVHQADIFFKLSNQSTATLPGKLLHELILKHAAASTTSSDNADAVDEAESDSEAETEFVLPLQNGPGQLAMKLTGVVPKRALAKLMVQCGRKFSSGGTSSKRVVTALPAAVLAPVATPLQTIGRIVRKVPVPVFALAYALLTHFLWSGSSADSGGGLAVVAVLLLVPSVYLAVKLDHPLSSLFHASSDAGRGSDVDSDSHHHNNGSHHAVASLKLIITEYRFVLSAHLPAAATSSDSATSPVAHGGGGHALAAPGSTGPIPRRYINAEKGNETKARERFMATLAWRQEKELDTILSRPWPHFRTIKANYPHYYHKRGNQGEPVYYEKPGKINLKQLKASGLTLKDLMHNYLMVSEFLWQVLEPDDNRKCISVLDVEGIGITDFAGEAVEYVRNAAAVSGGHYPERCAYIFVINVPSWFSVIWNTVKTMVDEVTREKVIIVRGSKKKILDALAEKIPLENIPEEYGGTSPGMSKEETLLYNLMAYLNEEGTKKSNPVDDYRKEQQAIQQLAGGAPGAGAGAGGGAPGLRAPGPSIH